MYEYPGHVREYRSKVYAMSVGELEDEITRISKLDYDWYHKLFLREAVEA